MNAAQLLTDIEQLLLPEAQHICLTSVPQCKRLMEKNADLNYQVNILG